MKSNFSEAGLTITVTPGGHLKLVAGHEAREEIHDILERLARVGSSNIDIDVLWEVLETYSSNGAYEPFDAGQANPFVGLTSAPCIAERMIYEEDGTKTIDGRLWWYPNYQIESPVDTLAKTGEVIFTLAQ